MADAEILRPDVTLHIVATNGAELYLKIKRATPMRKVMEWYCKKRDIRPANLRFIYNGTTVEACETVNDLDVPDHEDIKIEAEELVSLEVVFAIVATNGAELHFKMKRTTVTRHAMHAYCKRKKIPLAHLRFIYDGTTVDASQTANDLDIRHNDRIEAAALVCRVDAAVRGAEQPLRLPIRDGHGGFTGFFIKRTTPMKKLMAAYSTLQGVPRDGTVLFTQRGLRSSPQYRIDGAQTADDAGVHDGDELFAQSDIRHPWRIEIRTDTPRCRSPSQPD
jgi:small ubiquitin-related modifier